MIGLVDAAAVVVFVATAPLLVWAERRVKASMQMRRGPGVLQPYRDLRRLWSKSPVMPAQATFAYRWMAAVSFGLVAAALLTLPLAGPTRGSGGAVALLVLALVLALHRFVLAAQAYATGTPFGGLGSSRELFLGGLGEPALVLAVAAIFLKTGQAAVPATTLPAVDPSTWLALIAILLLWIAESARIPFDNPATHLELTMVHEALILESSGPMLALYEWGAAVKQSIFASLVILLAVPLPTATVPRVAALLLGTIVLSALLAFLESGIAKVRLFRASHILIMAGLVGFLGGVVTYLEGGSV